LEVEPEEKLDADLRRPLFLQSYVEKSVKEMRDKKATGDGDVFREVASRTVGRRWSRTNG